MTPRFRPQVDLLEAREVPAVVTSSLSMHLWENTPTPNTVATGSFTYDDVTVNAALPSQLIPVSDLSFTLVGQTFTEVDVSGAVQVRYRYGQLDGVVFDINATPGGYPYDRIQLDGGWGQLTPDGGSIPIPIPVDYIDRTTLVAPAPRGLITFRNGEHNYRITVSMETNVGNYSQSFDLAATTANGAREQLLTFLREAGWDARAKDTESIEIYGKSTGGGTGLEPIKSMRVTLENVQNNTPGVMLGGTTDVHRTLDRKK